MSALDLRRLAEGARPDGNGDPVGSLAEAAALMEGLPDDQLVELRSAFAVVVGDLEQPAAVRQLAAVLDRVAETALGGLTDWDALLDAGTVTNAIWRGETSTLAETERVNDGGR